MAGSANSPAFLSSSRSTRRHFPWSTSKVTSEEEEEHYEIPTSSNYAAENHNTHSNGASSSAAVPPRRKLPPVVVVSRIRSAFAAFRRMRPPQGRRRLGHRFVGTLFGHRHGHVNFVLQTEEKSSPVFFVELATPITGVVKEMASGSMVRISLECDKHEGLKTAATLLEEPLWRTYCNGKRSGYAKKKEAGPKEMKVLKAVEPISMGAGLLPGFDGGGASPDGELMFMRAKFERVVGSRESEAFYMMNPDFNGTPELSIYLLRV
ncbi:hypothetical protein Nepgr_007069 [Nepenthes gracilis]|uniref:Protein MIZU-KUSSEI 1 n=1 Tax=Nepenthes gracilis TaxID=150966 RepID=A0AAD3S6I1_NEPGR|nr:hypothetical protein Nepgr_007069 [Nepenthes gracilis]